MLFFTCMAALAQSLELQNFYKVRLSSVYDGDTFKVYLACSYPVFCSATPVRVRGIDAPEIRGANECEKQKAKEARAFTQQFLESGKIYLKNCERDKYFRLLCDVQADKKDLSTALLEANLAVVYDGGKKQEMDWCK